MTFLTLTACSLVSIYIYIYQCIGVKICLLLHGIMLAANGRLLTIPCPAVRLSDLECNHLTEFDRIAAYCSAWSDLAAEGGQGAWDV
jgi:hypothetical protein